jgi:exonuclease III
MTTIATWNLHHMGREVTIPNGVVPVIEAVHPDVLLLTEYVDRGDRAVFQAELRDKCGYALPRVSPAGKEPRQNQVLVASRVEQEDADLHAPEVDEAAKTNFLHQRFRELDLEVVGFRVPHYQSEKPKRPEKLVEYWRQFTDAALGRVSKKIVFIGDFNVGSTRMDAVGRDALKKLVKAGYRMCAEEGGLDRALVSPALKVRSFSMIESVGPHRLTGQGGLSDHPMLVVEVE